MSIKTGADHSLCCDNVNLENEDLTGADFSELSFQCANFKNATVRNVIFKKVNLTFSVFTGTGSRGLNARQLAEANNGCLDTLKVENSDEVTIEIIKDAKLIQGLQSKIPHLETEVSRLQTSNSEKDKRIHKLQLELSNLRSNSNIRPHSLNN